MIPGGDWLRTRVRVGQIVVVTILGEGGLAIGLVFLASWLGVWSRPQVVVQQYVASVYAHDYSRAYELISGADKAVKSQEEYLRENRPFTRFTLEAARQLATYIEYPEIQTESQGGRATVTVKFIVPDGNAEEVKEILFPDSGALASQEDELSEAERRTLLAKLDQLHESGQIPTFEGEQTFELVQEQGQWRIVENWAETVRVHFSAEVKHGLPWEFEPVQEVVLAKPGETLQAVYRVKNLSDQLVTAKARHIDKPEEYTDFLEVIQCFCFIQQTLKPGEAAELPLVFRVEWDTPDEVKDFYVHYEFYPLELFPKE